jgi:hypothetical protein
MGRYCLLNEFLGLREETTDERPALRQPRYADVPLATLKGRSECHAGISAFNLAHRAHSYVYSHTGDI